MAIVDNASKVVGKVYSRKRLADMTSINCYKIVFSIISVCLAGIFIGLIYLAILEDILIL